MSSMLVLLPALLVVQVSSSCIDITDTFGKHSLPEGRRWHQLDLVNDRTGSAVMYGGNMYPRNHFLAMLCNAALAKYNRDHPATEPLVLMEITDPDDHLVMVYVKVGLRSLLGRPVRGISNVCMQQIMAVFLGPCWLLGLTITCADRDLNC